MGRRKDEICGPPGTKIQTNLNIKKYSHWHCLLLPSIFFPILPSYLIFIQLSPLPHAALTSISLGGPGWLKTLSTSYFLSLLPPYALGTDSGVGMRPKLFNQRISELSLGRLGQVLSFLLDDFLCWLGIGSETRWLIVSLWIKMPWGGPGESKRHEWKSRLEPCLLATPSPLDFSSHVNQKILLLFKPVWVEISIIYSQIQ